jgi:hypothetical protein
MDEEIEAALALEGHQLRAMRDAGEPGVVARQAPRRATGDDAIVVSVSDFAGVTIVGLGGVAVLSSSEVRASP